MVDNIQKMRRPSDSFFTKVFARSISVRITPLFAKTNITPLQVTILGLFVGLCAAWVGSSPVWLYGLLAAVFMEFSHVLDCVDGELARLTGRGTPFAASLDPITDRLKDMAVIYAAYLQSLQSQVLSLSESSIANIAFLTIAFWIFYMYVVDAFLNPSRRNRSQKNGSEQRRTYLGLYDLFIYGSVTFWIFHIFEYFMFYVFFMSIIGSCIQIIRLRRLA